MNIDRTSKEADQLGGLMGGTESPGLVSNPS